MISFVGYATITSGTSIDLTAISDLSEGDLVVVSAGVSSSQGSVNLPSGWTAGDSGQESYYKYRWCYKAMGSVPDSSVVVKTSSNYGAGIAAAFRGVDLTNTLDVSSPSHTTSFDPPSITTVTNGAAVVALCGGSKYLSGTITAPSGAPSGYAFVAGLLNGNYYGCCLGAAYLIPEDHGVKDPGAFPGASAAGGIASMTLALRPAIDAPVGSPLFGVFP